MEYVRINLILSSGAVGFDWEPIIAIGLVLTESNIDRIQSSYG